MCPAEGIYQRSGNGGPIDTSSVDLIGHSTASQVFMTSIEAIRGFGELRGEKYDGLYVGR